MRVYLRGMFYTVCVSGDDVDKFKRRFPCSGLPDAPISFEFDRRNGDLVDIRCRKAYQDGAGILALSQDAQQYGEDTLAKRGWS